MSKRVTIKDIARNLRVSPSTVSRALKDNPEISAETKSKVWKLAKELDYEPNTLALGLKQSRSNTIGVILPEIVHFFFSTVISGIEEVATKRGYNVIISQSNETYEKEVADVKTLYNHRVDGILACITKETEVYDHFIAVQDKGTPIAFFDRLVPTVDATTVVIDDAAGGHLAANHLLKSGKRHLIHLAGADGLSLSKDRMTGFKQAHLDNNIPFDESQIEICDTLTGAEIIIQKLIDEKIPFDGIFAVNDMTAIGAIQTLKKNNISIPDQVAVVGFSNWEFCAFVDPSLTSISQSGKEMGQQATELLINEIEMSENEFIEPEKIIIPVKLVVRDSS